MSLFFQFVKFHFRHFFLISMEHANFKNLIMRSITPVFSIVA